MKADRSKSRIPIPALTRLSAQTGAGWRIMVGRPSGARQSRPTSEKRSDMHIHARTFPSLVLAAALALGGTPMLAHHGWSWAEGEQTTLEGTIESVSMNPPHPTIQVRDAQGTVWQVDLGNPNQTARSGFAADTAQPGDAITVIGNRNQDQSAHMKAVRIVIDGQNYDMYPERIQD
jgi:hypothetical protein